MDEKGIIRIEWIECSHLPSCQPPRMGLARQALDGGTGSLRSHTRFDRNACSMFNGTKLSEW
jgi:hypothetical protein